MEFVCKIKFSRFKHNIWSGHMRHKFIFFSYCVLILGIYPLNAEGIEMSCGTCITRVVTEFIIPVARQWSHSITVGCHTAHISHRFRILMGDTFQLYFSFSVYLTHSQWAKTPPTSMASKLFSPYSLHQEMLIIFYLLFETLLKRSECSWRFKDQEICRAGG